MTMLERLTDDFDTSRDGGPQFGDDIWVPVSTAPHAQNDTPTPESFSFATGEYGQIFEDVAATGPSFHVDLLAEATHRAAGRTA